MRIGDVVLYAEAPGTLITATVTALHGSGASGCKVLSLRSASGRDVQHVPHVKDCFVAAGYWCQREDEARPVTRDTTEWQSEVQLAMQVEMDGSADTSAKQRRRSRDRKQEDEE